MKITERATGREIDYVWLTLTREEASQLRSAVDQALAGERDTDEHYHVSSEDYTVELELRVLPANT